MFKTKEIIENNCIGIYKIESPSGKVYIGQSNNIKRRKKHYELLHCKQQQKLYNSFKKYGIEAHTFEIVTTCSEEDLNSKERYYQEHYDCMKKGLNLKLTQTNDKSGVLSEETRKRISERLKGENHVYYGRKLPEFHRKILLEFSHNQKPMTEEMKKRISLRLKNRKFSEETISKMSKNNHMSRKVIDTSTQIVYNSVKEVSKVFNLNYNTLMCRLNENNTRVKNNTTFKYI